MDAIARKILDERVWHCKAMQGRRGERTHSSQSNICDTARLRALRTGETPEPIMEFEDRKS
jgi:hypothetical protein